MNMSVVEQNLAGRVINAKDLALCLLDEKFRYALVRLGSCDTATQVLDFYKAELPSWGLDDLEMHQLRPLAVQLMDRLP